MDTFRRPTQYTPRQRVRLPMQTPQRGSVLLTIIGGIIILALFGMAAVSLMTGSVMAGLDAKETVQASYLAESGKEIVRVQAAKADTGAKLMALADNALDGKTFSIAGGDISLKLFPSWFRTSEAGTLLTGGSGWYPEAPSGTRELLLIAKPGTASRAEYSFGEATALTPNADAYLIGRGTPTYPTQAQTAISVSTATNDFDYFPETGGLIGVVDKGGATLNPDSAKRLTYERLSKSGSTYTFEGVRPSQALLTRNSAKARNSSLGNISAWSAKPRPPTAHGPHWYGTRTEEARCARPAVPADRETAAYRKCRKHQARSKTKTTRKPFLAATGSDASGRLKAKKGCPYKGMKEPHRIIS